AVVTLGCPVRLACGETCRDVDGLAMSSRNRYRSAAERALAPGIHRALLAMREGLAGGADRDEVEEDARARLEQAGFAVDYAVIRTTALAEPGAGDRQGRRVALIAARLGATRLIDNLEFDLP